MKPISSGNIGTLLIALSIGMFILLLFPLFALYYMPPQGEVTEQPSEQFRISIPKIHAYSPIITGVDPWNKKEYHEALKHGVAQAEGTGLPGEGRTVYLFAHSTGMPWEQFSYNTIFLRLGELQSGDEILLDMHKKRYTYRVVDKKEVWPNNISYLLSTDKNILVLQTCTPIGTTLKRLLVFAEPVND